jgi:hypothetical protein
MWHWNKCCIATDVLGPGPEWVKNSPSTTLGQGVSYTSLSGTSGLAPPLGTEGEFRPHPGAASPDQVAGESPLLLPLACARRAVGRALAPGLLRDELDVPGGNFQAEGSGCGAPVGLKCVWPKVECKLWLVRKSNADLWQS